MGRRWRGTYGVERCPAGALAGPLTTGTLWVAFGDEWVYESVSFQAVFGEREEVLFVIEGHTPATVELIAKGTYTSDTPPYGRVLTVKLPYIETVPGRPYASFTSLALGLGAFREEGNAIFASVTMPAECRGGSFGWAADAGFDGEPAAAAGTVNTGCPSGVARAGSKTVLTVSSNTPYENETDTYTATVTPRAAGWPAPTGAVTFLGNGQPISGCTDQPLIAGSGSSTATCTVSSFYSERSRVVAQYTGDSTYGFSESGAECVAVSDEEAPKSHMGETRKEEPQKSENATAGGAVTVGTPTNTPTGPGPTVRFTSAQLAALALGLHACCQSICTEQNGPIAASRLARAPAANVRPCA